ncbi:MAG: hypothetical protein EBR10_06505 [Planctomycetes bacterium]|nr:hypothetical protein [Planctomycetota bacterium]
MPAPQSQTISTIERPETVQTPVPRTVQGALSSGIGGVVRAGAFGAARAQSTDLDAELRRRVQRIRLRAN